MIVRKAEVPPIHFGQLVIHDYTQGDESSSSLATIHVPPGADHPRAWSTRSDKYYYVLGGHVRFSLGREDYDLMPGDFCFVRQGERFSYVNLSSESATLLLVHTPRFDLNAEVMEV